LNYGIFDITKAREGICHFLWKGLWRDKINILIRDMDKAYIDLAPSTLEYINAIDLFFAEIDVDSNTRKHIEGSIGWNLRNNHKEFKLLYPDDNRVGTSSKLGVKLIISCDTNIAGLDENIEI
jgi:hypothetical protein